MERERESLSRFGIEKIVVFWNFLIGGSMRRGSRQVEAGWGIGERGFGLETLESERRQVGLDDLLG